MRRVRRTFLQRFVQVPVDILSDVPPVALADVRGRAVTRLPWSPVRSWPFGRSRLAVRRLRRQLHGLMPGRVPDFLRPPSHRLPSWPRLRRSHRAEQIFVLVPPRRSERSGALRSSSPGTSSLAGCPPPDGPVRVYSRRSEDLLRPMVATPSVSLRPRGFSPPRRLLPRTASGMLQPVPGVGSPGFPLGRSSRPCGLWERVLGPRWRFHPAKVFSSSAAVPHRCGLLPSCRSSPRRPRGHRASLRPRLATRWGRAVRSSSTITSFCVDVTLQDRGVSSSARRLPSPRGLPLESTRRASGTGPHPVTRLRLAAAWSSRDDQLIRSDRVLLEASRPRGPRLRPHLT